MREGCESERSKHRDERRSLRQGNLQIGSEEVTSLDCIFDASLAARNLSRVPRFCNSDPGFGSAS
jgi:hypothetical protein